MKAIIHTIFMLSIATTAFANGPWSEYLEKPPQAATPAALAGVYVRAAQQRDFSECRSYMTPEYEAWLERVGGVEACLDVFVNADLQKRFAWRQTINGEKATVWIRVHVITRAREVNVALNLVRTGSGWKLTK